MSELSDAELIAMLRSLRDPDERERHNMLLATVFNALPRLLDLGEEAVRLRGVCLRHGLDPDRGAGQQATDL